MDELYEVLSVLYEIADNFKNIIYVMDKLENLGEEKEMTMILSMLAYYMTHVEQDLQECVKRVDKCHLRMRKEIKEKYSRND